MPDDNESDKVRSWDHPDLSPSENNLIRELGGLPIKLIWYSLKGIAGIAKLPFILRRSGAKLYDATEDDSKYINTIFQKYLEGQEYLDEKVGIGVSGFEEQPTYGKLRDKIDETWQAIPEEADVKPTQEQADELYEKMNELLSSLGISSSGIAYNIKTDAFEQYEETAFKSAVIGVKTKVVDYLEDALDEMVGDMSNDAKSIEKPLVMLHKFSDALRAIYFDTVPAQTD